MGKRASGDICRHVSTSGIRVEHRSGHRRRVHQSDCLAQSQGQYSPMSRYSMADGVQLLRDVGLDFTFLLSTLLQPDPMSSQPHPIFSSTLNQTPGPGYHIEPSPYPTHFTDTPAPDHFDPVHGSTAPLSLKGRRRPSEGGRSREGTPRSQTPESSRPAPPARNVRRVDSNHSGRVSQDSMR